MNSHIQNELFAAYSKPFDTSDFEKTGGYIMTFTGSAELILALLFNVSENRLFLIFPALELKTSDSLSMLK